MKISTKGRYGLRVLLDLAAHSGERHIPLREISKRQNITIKYLEQIMTPLLRAGYIVSYRGNCGGYALAVDPAELSLGDILRTMEGSLAPVACLEGEQNPCLRRDDCRTLKVWEDFDRLIKTYFDGIYLIDLLGGTNETCSLTKHEMF